MSTGFRHTAALVLCALAVCGSRASASTLTVTTTNDGGPASLREALAVAAPGDTIVLDVTGTITLTNGALSVMKNVTIAGPGASLLAIDAQHASRVFDVGSVWTPATVALSGVTLTNGSAGYGAGIQNLGALYLLDVTLKGNTASNEGGAIWNRGTLYLTDTRVTANSAMVGGGINNYQGLVVIMRSTISGNTADGVYGGIGGAIASQTSGYIGDLPTEGLTIRDSAVFNNSASLRGGAIYNGSGLLTIVNSTIAGNAGTYTGSAGSCLCAGGGAIYNASGTAYISDSTIAGNSAAAAGGAITSVYGMTNLKTSILAKGTTGPNCYSPYGKIQSYGYNLSDDASCGGAFTAAGDRNGLAAGLSPMGLEDNGGGTPTIQLLPDSPAIDAAPAGECEQIDQRGVHRPQGSACDVGAYERVPSPYSATVEMPINADGSTVFTANRGVVPVRFTLSVNGAAACELPRATIGVAQLSGDSIGPVTDTTYELPADDGRDFRVGGGSCQYTYNLATAVFTPGRYWTSISIDGVVVGSAVFAIR